MATVNELKATARPKSGKGAARAVRRTGNVPAVVYGGDEGAAEVSLQRAVELSPATADARVSLADLYLAKGRFDDGERLLRVDLEYGAGRLEVGPGEPGTLYRATLRYDERHFQPRPERWWPAVDRRDDGVGVEADHRSISGPGGIGGLDDLLSGYRAAGGAPIDPEQVRYWEVFGNVKWAVGCLTQSRRHLNGRATLLALLELGAGQAGEPGGERLEVRCRYLAGPLGLAAVADGEQPAEVLVAGARGDEQGDDERPEGDPDRLFGIVSTTLSNRSAQSTSEMRRMLVITLPIASWSAASRWCSRRSISSSESSCARSAVSGKSYLVRKRMVAESASVAVPR